MPECMICGVPDLNEDNHVKLHEHPNSDPDTICVICWFGLNDKEKDYWKFLYHDIVLPENDNMVEVPYDSSKPKLMRRVMREWRNTTNASTAVQRDILYQWMMGGTNFLVNKRFLENLKQQLNEE